MKKFFVIFCLMFFGISAFADESGIPEYQRIYEELPVPTHSYIHNVDPDQFYDNVSTTWSPYPSFRLVSPIYFKSITIEPGYYLLTPRQYKGDWFLLFKQSGYVKYIVPVYNRDITPEFFYKQNLPKEKLTFGQKLQINGAKWIGDHFKCAQRKSPPGTYLEVSDLDNNFLSLVVYWGDFRYYTIFKTTKL